MDYLRGDRPIKESDPDRLGFRPVAKRLARALTADETADGLVVGIEGRWGSGKSSLLNLLTAEISAARPEARVIDYRPWLVSDRDGMLASLFDVLALSVEATQVETGNVASFSLAKAQRAAEDLRGFAKKASRLGPLASLAAAFLPGAGPMVDAVRGWLDAVAATESTTPLVELKSTLARDLAELGARLVVTIDDVDRLEPHETIELLRLVRAVADFPNVTYVLCFDAEVLAHNVETALSINDGQAFVEKIVQVLVPVPTPEAFDLRHWFADELGKLVGPLDRKQKQSLDRAVDMEGGRRLQTPRSVVRVLDALRLKVPALRSDVDLGDLVWLELIKVGNLPFYRWIEAYCSAYAAMWPGRVQVSEEAAKGEFEALVGHLTKDKLTFEAVEWELDERLPGIGHSNGGKLFDRSQSAERARAISGRRLSSPDHHRFYFALSPPRNAITAADLEVFETSCEKSSDAAGKLLLEWLSLTQTNGASKSEVVLGRLNQQTISQLSPTFSENLIFGLANILDLVAADFPATPIGSFQLWHDAGKLWPKLIPGADVKPRPIVLSLFTEGRSLAWLTDLFRTECFAHGRAMGHEARGGAIVTLQELDLIIPAMIARYRSVGIRRILGMATPANMIWAWFQAGDQEFVKAEVQNFTKTGAGLVAFLDTFISTSTSSTDGERQVLNKSNFDKFFDNEGLSKRLANLATKKSLVGRRAKELVAYIEAANRP